MIFDTTYLVGLQSRFLKNDTLLDTLTCNTFSEYIGTKCFLIFFLFYYETLMTSFKLLCISVDLLLLSECYINLIKNDDGEDSFSSFSGKTPLPSFFLGKQKTYLLSGSTIQSPSHSQPFGGKKNSLLSFIFPVTSENL